MAMLTPPRPPSVTPTGELAPPVDAATDPMSDAPAGRAPSGERDLSTAAAWGIEPGWTHLNHGSYGFVPLAVHRRQIELQREMNAEPVRWFVRSLEEHSDRASDAVGAAVGADADDLALVPNGTLAVATALRSLDLRDGDEVLVTDHEYDATLNELRRMADGAGWSVRRASVPFPMASADEALDAIDRAMTPRTRAVVVSHITSATSMVMPIERVARLAEDRGAALVVDGAHGPGQIPVDVGAIGAPFYASSAHKWLAAPKGAGFLHVRRELHGAVRPLALSSRVHFPRPDRARFKFEFDYVGTMDNTAYLVLPESIALLGEQLPGGLGAVQRRNHELAVAGRRVICERLGIEPPCPDELVPSMASIVLPKTPGWLDPSSGRDPGPFGDPLWNTLAARYRIQAPVVRLAPLDLRIVRVSAHLHNRLEDYQRLADALAAEL